MIDQEFKAAMKEYDRRLLERFVAYLRMKYIQQDDRGEDVVPVFHIEAGMEQFLASPEAQRDVTGR